MDELRAWIAQHPSGRWLILMPQPDFKGWWRQLGSHAEYKGAVDMANNLGLKIEPPSRPKKIKPRRLPIRVRRITPRLLQILKFVLEHRDDLARGDWSMLDAAAECGVSHAGLIYNVGVLADLGYVRMIYRNQGQRLRFDITEQGIDQLNLTGSTSNAEQSA